MIRENKGFTLIETMLSLFLLSIVIFLFPLIFSFFSPIKSNDKLSLKEVELFYMQISREIHGAKSVRIDGEKLFVRLKTDEEASYEQYNNLIRRRLQNTGHEVLLQNIHSVKFNILKHNLISIKVTGKNGEIYKRKFVLMSEEHEK